MKILNPHRVSEIESLKTSFVLRCGFFCSLFFSCRFLMFIYDLLFSLFLQVFIPYFPKSQFSIHSNIYNTKHTLSLNRK